MLCELETDKVTVEVPAPAAGVLGEIVADEGETVGRRRAARHHRREGAAPSRPSGQAEPREPRPRPRQGRAEDRRQVDRRRRRIRPGERAVDRHHGADPRRERHRGHRLDLVQEGRRRGRPGRDALRARDRQGLGRGARRPPAAPSPRSSPRTAPRSRPAASSAASPAAQRGRDRHRGAAPPRRRPPRRRPAAGRSDVEDAPSAKKLMADKGVDRDAGRGHRPRRPRS